METIMSIPKIEDFLEVKMVNMILNNDGNLDYFKGRIRLDQVHDYFEDFRIIEQEKFTHDPYISQEENQKRLEEYKKNLKPSKKIVGTSISFWKSQGTLFIPMPIEIFEEEYYYPYLEKKHAAL